MPCCSPINLFNVRSVQSFPVMVNIFVRNFKKLFLGMPLVWERLRMEIENISGRGNFENGLTLDTGLTCAGDCLPEIVAG